MAELSTRASTSSGDSAAGRAAALSLFALSLLAAIVAVVILIPTSDAGFPEPVEVGGLASLGGLATAVALVVLGGLSVVRGTAGSYGRLMLLSGSLLAFVHLGQAISILGVWGSTRLPDGVVAAAVWVQDLWMLWFACVVLWMPALFPTGTAAPGWRRPVRALSALWAVELVLHWLIQRPATGMFLDVVGAPANPTGVLPLPMDVVNIGWALATLGSVVVAIGSTITRWRTAGHVQRRQLKIALHAFAIVAVVMGGLIVNTGVVESGGPDVGIQPLLDGAMQLAWAWLAIALGVAVLQHRLYDVDLVINRTLVYGVMLALVTAAYVTVVVVVGAALPNTDATAPSLAATVLVAVAFAPVRARVQQGVNRLVFGQRDDPLAVLGRLGEVLDRTTTPQDTLADVARTVGDALKLPGVAVDLFVTGEWERTVVHGHVDKSVEVLPLRHGGREVGRLVVARRSPAEPLHADDRRVLDTVAHHLAALAHGLQLTKALQRSRERLVVAREDERRRLRRDLHDGFGPTLASQALWLDTVRDQVRHDPEAAVRQLDVLKGQTQHLVSDIRRIVHELRPPALDDLGLVGAISSHIANLPGDTLSIELDASADALGELEAAVEVAAYRICVEAITNVVRHARASRCSVELARDDDALEVVVRDDGQGIPPGTPPGVGTRSMHERAEELGGSVRLRARPAGGTVVHARLPVASRPSPHTRSTVRRNERTADV